MIGGFGITELVIILAIVVFIFGARRIPELGSNLAKGVKSFKKTMKEPDYIDVTPADEGGEKKEEPQG